MKKSGQGSQTTRVQAKILELPLGVYTVTFRLAGFRSVIREGVEVRTGFTATANADMLVGALEESITVSGASPVVDVHNVRSQQMLTRELLDSLPTSRDGQGDQILTLGATTGAGRYADVGGNRGDSYADLAVHGNRTSDMKTLLDGMRIETAGGVSGGIYSNYRINHTIVEEVVLETSGFSAEAQTGGVQMNVVPKDGGNTFRGVLEGAYTNGDLQSDNLSDELRRRGITSTPYVKSIYDGGGASGGPIKTNKLWFYTGHRWWGAGQYMPEAYFNKTQHTLFYTPDLSRQTYRDNPVEDHSVRLTWQAAEKHKIGFFSMYQLQCACYYLSSATFSPEATEHVKFAVPTVQGSWSYPATSRLLFQGGVAYVYDNRWNARPEETLPTDVPVTELSTGLRYGADPRISQIGYAVRQGRSSGWPILGFVCHRLARDQGWILVLFRAALASGGRADSTDRVHVPQGNPRRPANSRLGYVTTLRHKRTSIVPSTTVSMCKINGPFFRS